MWENTQLEHTAEQITEKTKNYGQNIKVKFNCEEIKKSNVDTEEKARTAKDLPGKIQTEDSLIQTQGSKTKKNNNQKGSAIIGNEICSDKKELKLARKQGVRNYAVQVNLSATTIFRENCHM